MFAHWLPAYFPIRDPVLIFAIVLVLFLVAPMGMARFRLPGMIGLLLAGAILGPHALGILARDSSFVLLGAVGLIYIMFTAALEIDLSVFRRYGIQGIVFGLLTFLIPQGLGTLVARYLLGFDWLPAVLLASMFASHTLLAYPIVSRLGLSTNHAVTATLGATIITDTLALLVLAVVAAMAQGRAGEAMWWRLGVSLTVYVSAILIGLPRAGRWFFRKAPDDATAQFVFILSSVFLCAALSHAAGLEPIVGAFLAGIALNRLIPHNSALMGRLTFTGEAVFIPFFLLSVGMLLDARVLFGGFRSWVVAIGMTVTVIGTKWLAAEGARLLFRYRPEEGRIMFGLSVVQAAATLAAVMVGHRIGLFDDAVINGTIVMILVTCILGPYLVAKYAQPLAATAASEPKEVDGRGILVPLRSVEQVEPAIELALLLRQSRSRDPIFPAFVAADGGELTQAMAGAEKIFAVAARQASAANCVIEPVKRVDDHPGRALVRARKEMGASTVVLPWNGEPGGGNARRGRVIDELVADSAADLLLCRLPNSLSACARVLVLFPPGVGQGGGFARTIEILKQIARQLGAPLLLIGQQDDKDTLTTAFVRVAESVRRSFGTYPSLRMWIPVLDEHVRDTDLLVVYGVRDGDPSSSDEYRGIAERVAGKYPGHNLIVLFGAGSPS